MVADKSRTEKTICLAVTPSLKSYGISGRARLFEVVQRVAEANAQRRRNAPRRQLTGSSWHDPGVKAHPELALDYMVAPPRMAHYIEWSTKIYNVYLKYVAPEDVFAYSIDEVLMDVTNYLPTYQLTPRELARKIVLDVLATTGITATAGIGTNLYLAKVAMETMTLSVCPAPHLPDTPVCPWRTGRRSFSPFKPYLVTVQPFRRQSVLPGSGWNLLRMRRAFWTRSCGICLKQARRAYSHIFCPMKKERRDLCRHYGKDQEN